MDLSGKIMRLYEDCKKCKGKGTVRVATTIQCPQCNGKGTITSYVKFEELNRAMQDIAKAAVKSVLAEEEKETRDTLDL